jgi:hypothetical protein
MTETPVEMLFDEFATLYLRGEHPDVAAYLERAGAEGEELGRMLDAFLQAAPARKPTEEEVVLMQARLEQEPPLLLLRQRRKLKRGAVVDALVAALGLDPAKREKVDGYYHRLETGLLDPGGVSRKVWDALGAFLHANAEGLAGVRPAPPPAPATAYLRQADLQEQVLYSLAVEHVREEPEQDEIDRLFTAGP